MEKKLYHGTTGANYDSILGLGFTKSEIPGRWGCGIYFFDDINSSRNFGDILLSVDVNLDGFEKLYYDDLAEQFGLSVHDEEGLTTIQDYYPSANGLVVIYDDGVKEVVVYNLSCIKSWKEVIS